MPETTPSTWPASWRSWFDQVEEAYSFIERLASRTLFVTLLFGGLFAVLGVLALDQDKGWALHCMAFSMPIACSYIVGRLFCDAVTKAVDRWSQTKIAEADKNAALQLRLAGKEEPAP